MLIELSLRRSLGVVKASRMNDMTQITAIGPLGLDYIDPDNDPCTSHRP
jgi:hypothetical protein